MKKEFLSKNWWQFILIALMIGGQISSYTKLQASVEELDKYKANKSDLNIEKEKLQNVKDDIQEIKGTVNKIYELILKK